MMQLVERLLGLCILGWLLWAAWTVLTIHIERRVRERLNVPPPQAPPPEACSSPFCLDMKSDRDLFREALVNMAYDPGWPEEPAARVEEMKAFALATLRSARALSLKRR